MLARTWNLSERLQGLWHSQPWAGFTRNTMGGSPRMSPSCRYSWRGNLDEGKGTHCPRQPRVRPPPLPCWRPCSSSPATARASELRRDCSRSAMECSYLHSEALRSCASRWTPWAHWAVRRPVDCVGLKGAGSRPGPGRQHQCAEEEARPGP